LRVWQEIDGMLHGSAALGGPGMFATLIKLFKNEDGATAIEYGLIAALIAVAAGTVLGTVGTKLSNTFNTVATKLQAFRRRSVSTTRGSALVCCPASL